MSTINPLLASFSPAPAQRSGGASASSSPPAAAVSPVASARPVEAATSPLAQGLQAAQGLQPQGDAERTPQDREDLQRALDETLQDVQTSLRFRVDDEANRVVVSVVDRGSGDVIYQIPSDVALQIAKRMAELGSGMINESA